MKQLILILMFIVAQTGYSMTAKEARIQSKEAFIYNTALRHAAILIEAKEQIAKNVKWGWQEAYIDLYSNEDAQFAKVMLESDGYTVTIKYVSLSYRVIIDW